MQCSVQDCHRESHSRGFCAYHYNLKKRSGDLKNIYQKRGAIKSHPLYSTYRNMISRCQNPNYHHYKDYGGRGVTICKRWLCSEGFSNFVSDMGVRPKGFQIDRIDVNGDYEPENCRWVSKHTQMSNLQASSNHTGVTYMKSRNKWRARIKVDKKEIHIGLFENREQALTARRKKEKELCIQ